MTNAVGAKKPKRRPNGDGTVRYRERDRLWEARATIEGKQRSFHGKTEREARQKMRDAQKKADAGVNIAAGRGTVAAFLGEWLEGTVKPANAPKTYASYREIVVGHLVPGLGKHRLDKLTPAHVNALLRSKEAAGLSPRRVSHIRAVLRNALNVALRWRWVEINAAALATPPKQVRTEAVPFSEQDARSILVAAEGERLAALWRVALSLGMRQGEVLGLTWADVDLDEATLSVRQAAQRIDGKIIFKEPKSHKSRRRLKLPNSLIAALKVHRTRQVEERLAAGNRWQDSGLIFTSTIGTPIDPRNLIREWHRLLAKAELDRRPFHTTRHTAASFLLAQGVPLKVVQEVLGHSLLSTTADIYAHLAPAAFQEAADAMDRALAD